MLSVNILTGLAGKESGLTNNVPPLRFLCSAHHLPLHGLSESGVYDHGLCV